VTDGQVAGLSDEETEEAMEEAGGDDAEDDASGPGSGKARPVGQGNSGNIFMLNKK